MKNEPTTIPERGQRRMWTVKQLAAATGDSADTISQKCRLGKIQAVKHGYDWRIPAHVADAIVDGKVSI